MSQVNCAQYHLHQRNRCDLVVLWTQAESSIVRPIRMGNVENLAGRRLRVLRRRITHGSGAVNRLTDGTARERSTKLEAMDAEHVERVLETGYWTSNSATLLSA